jgi:hypothetical protein
MASSAIRNAATSTGPGRPGIGSAACTWMIMLDADRAASDAARSRST